ncbi:zinc finger and BTB domain-containing protein 41 [Trichomycterus rosablanca]|uniref:zinc finger and BTB domain-containing protein 41 n=1 Tax=Trichomycterus rosablanca TaxID=2290929 RepID=UPI002F352574
MKMKKKVKPPPPDVVSESAGADADPSTQEKRRLRLSPSDSCFLEFLNKDRRARATFCDIAVGVQGETYHAHKVVLAFGSTYFHTKLTEDPQLERLALDNVESSVFGLLLDFLYTSELEVDEVRIPALAEAACFFDMMEAVNLLAGEVAPTGEQADHEERPEERPEEPESSRVCEVPTPQTPEDFRCTLCARTFRHQKSLHNHVIKIHSDAEGTKATGSSGSSGSSVSDPRPARRLRSASKFDTQETKKDLKMHEDTHSDEGTSSAEDEEYIHEDEDQELEGNKGKDSVEREASVMNEEMEEGSSNAPVAPCTKEPVYPEGLAPLIIQNGTKKTLKCPKCEKMFDRVGKYESHTRVHTREKPFQCEVCLQRYSTKSNLTVHKKKHAADAPVQRKDHKCPFCFKLHASRKTLSKHVKRFHPDGLQEFLSLKKKKSEGWKCDICHKSFTRRPHLEEHKILHSQDRPFKCAYCEESFKSRFTRLKHQEKFHLGPFPCDICGRQFNDTGNRKRHVECTHGGKRKWTCFLCGKSVRERTTLREHLRIHSGEKPHLCSICGQSFRHGSSYRLHLRVHHDDKRYECEECGKAFIRHDHLKKHRKIHTGERAHQCEECGKCFRRADHLNVHYKSIHLGEKVWRKYKAVVHQCEVCKKEFKGKTNLMMHFRTHSGEKPHRCEICNQTFRIKKTLTKHMVIHSEVRPFSCPHCSASFKRKDKLKYHMDHVHSTRPLNPAPPRTPSAPQTSQTHEPSAQAPGLAEVCVPVALVPVRIPEDAGADLHQQQSAGYQPSADLVFLEKYTLTPQPANIVHPVRSDHVLDAREPAYFGTLLGLDSASSEHAQ